MCNIGLFIHYLHAPSWPHISQINKFSLIIDDTQPYFILTKPQSFSANIQNSHLHPSPQVNSLGFMLDITLSFYQDFYAQHKVLTPITEQTQHEVYLIQLWNDHVQGCTNCINCMAKLMNTLLIFNRLHIRTKVIIPHISIHQYWVELSAYWCGDSIMSTGPCGKLRSQHLQLIIAHKDSHTVSVEIF